MSRTGDATTLDGPSCVQAANHHEGGQSVGGVGCFHVSTLSKKEFESGRADLSQQIVILIPLSKEFKLPRVIPTTPSFGEPSARISWLEQMEVLLVVGSREKNVFFPEVRDVHRQQLARVGRNALKSIFLVGLASRFAERTVVRKASDIGQMKY